MSPCENRILFIKDDFESYCVQIAKVLQKRPLEKVIFCDRLSKDSALLIIHLNSWLSSKEDYPQIEIISQERIGEFLDTEARLSPEIADLLHINIKENKCSLLKVFQIGSKLQKYPEHENWDSNFFHAVIRLSNLTEETRRLLEKIELRERLEETCFAKFFRKPG